MPTRNMGNNPVIPFALAVLLLASSLTSSHAQTPIAPPGISPIDEPATSLPQTNPVWEAPAQPVWSGVASEMYARGTWELQVLGGVYLGSSLGPLAPDWDYLPFSLRVGRIWTPPRWEGSRLLGSFETLLELSAAPVSAGPGNIVVGPSLLLRRNILWGPMQRIVPYIQGGAGIVYTDAGNDLSQQMIGQEMEFLLQAQVGVRTRLSPNWTLDVEGGYQHISNACLAPRNGGANNLGISIGFTFTLPCRR